MNRGTLYEVLGVAETATVDEIRHAFRERAKQHHPDRNPGDTGATARFKEVNTAYQTLGDTTKRAAYDAELRVARGAARAAQAVGGAAPPPSPPHPWHAAAVAPRPSSGSDLGDAIAWGLLALLFGAALSGGSGGRPTQRPPISRWDPYAQRHRGPDGRFTPG